MTEQEIAAKFKEYDEKLAKARGWWQPRWHAMQADPQAAVLCFVVGFVVSQLFPLHPLSWIGL